MVKVQERRILDYADVLCGYKLRKCVHNHWSGLNVRAIKGTIEIGINQTFCSVDILFSYKNIFLLSLKHDFKDMIFLNCSIIIDVQQKTVCSVTKWCHPFHSSGGAIITAVTLYTSHYRVVHPALDTRHSQTCKRCFTQFDTVVQY